MTASPPGPVDGKPILPASDPSGNEIRVGSNS
jgi:hypothetical protein